MDIFRTPVEVKPAALRASYRVPVVFAGSCFTENIGDWLHDLRFPVRVNPFGILYNPLSICHALENVILEKKYVESDLGFHNGRWFSFDHHGRFSNQDQAACLNGINSDIRDSAADLKKASHLFITPGTAWVYQLKHEGRIVGNCHKIPDQSFVRRMLEPHEMVQAFESLFGLLHDFNPDLILVLSISPVRHMRDGFTANQFSKSALFETARQILSESNKRFYFPAYEIMMDELRDYRFYAEDMIHPGNPAIKYIREKFAQAWLDEEAQEILKGMETLVNFRNHRSMYPESDEYRRFLLSARQQVRHFQDKYPFLNLSDDLRHFDQLLS